MDIEVHGFFEKSHSGLARVAALDLSEWRVSFTFRLWQALAELFIWWLDGETAESAAAYRLALLREQVSSVCARCARALLLTHPLRAPTERLGPRLSRWTSRRR